VTHEPDIVNVTDALRGSQDSQEVQIATADTVEKTQENYLREVSVDAQNTIPIDIGNNHQATTGEGASNPGPSTECGHGYNTVNSDSIDHQVVDNLASTNEALPQPQDIDEFLESISLSIQQPIFQETPQNPRVVNKKISKKNQREAEYSTQRKSTRLAKKAEVNVGKDAEQVAHDLLIRKLGELAGDESNPDEPDYEFYAQHFERPIELSKMQAIKTLIEQGNKRMQKSNIRGTMAAEVGLDA
jgi:hypothetical protein